MAVKATKSGMVIGLLGSPAFPSAATGSLIMTSYTSSFAATLDSVFTRLTCLSDYSRESIQEIFFTSIVTLIRSLSALTPSSTTKKFYLVQMMVGQRGNDQLLLGTVLVQCTNESQKYSRHMLAYSVGHAASGTALLSIHRSSRSLLESHENISHRIALHFLAVLVY